jgi:hypothetical protein
MKTQSISLIVLLFSISAAHANDFQFACTDSPTSPKLTLAGSSVEHFPSRYEVSAVAQVKDGGNLTMSDPSKEEATSYMGRLQDNSGNQISLYLGASFQNGAMNLNSVFGFGQLNTLPKDGKFMAVATVTQLNGQSTADLSNIQLNCLGVVKGGGSASFWSDLASAAVNAIT